MGGADRQVLAVSRSSLDGSVLWSMLGRVLRQIGTPGEREELGDAHAWAVPWHVGVEHEHLVPRPFALLAPIQRSGG